MEQMQKAFDYVDRHFEAMLTDLKEICACPGTASNPEGLEATRKCLISKMKRIGLQAI